MEQKAALLLLILHYGYTQVRSGSQSNKQLLRNQELNHSSSFSFSTTTFSSHRAESEEGEEDEEVAAEGLLDEEEGSAGDDAVLDEESTSVTKFKFTGAGPDSPRNVTVHPQRNGLWISWLPPLNTSGVAYYTVNYQTVGQWVQLTAKIVGKTGYLWRLSSRGMVYSFKVYSYSLDNVPSEPSAIITFNTGDPLLDGRQMSVGTIGGVVGGLITGFIVILCCVVICIKSCIKSQQRKKAIIV